MKQLIKGPLPDHGRNLMRRAGYAETPGYKGQISYARRIQGEYPRFHAYLDERNGDLEISLHIDQKKPTYQGSSAHSGEYEGPLVEQELARLVQFIESLRTSSSSSSTSSPSSQKKKGFFSRSLWVICSKENVFSRSTIRKPFSTSINRSS